MGLRRPVAIPSRGQTQEDGVTNPDYALIMARYNRWQNRNLLAAADRIGAEARAQDRGAFFGSIDKTFHHLYWADRKSVV